MPSPGQPQAGPPACRWPIRCSEHEGAGPRHHGFLPATHPGIPRRCGSIRATRLTLPLRGAVHTIPAGMKRKAIGHAAEYLHGQRPSAWRARGPAWGALRETPAPMNARGQASRRDARAQVTPPGQSAMSCRNVMEQRPGGLLRLVQDEWLRRGNAHQMGLPVNRCSASPLAGGHGQPRVVSNRLVPPARP
jgi:hypothetical protein